MTRKPRLLIADDRATTRSAIARMVKNEYEIVEVDDGAGAIACVKSGERFDAILMDVEMEVVSGREAFQRISIIAPDIASRIVFLTGGAKDEETENWLAAIDSSRVLWKPVAAVDLRAALGRASRSKKIDAPGSNVSKKP